jgi:DNA-binding PadR family transcriptional regulator
MLRHRTAHPADFSERSVLNQGTLYPALLRLEQHGWIRSEWGVSDNNRKAKYYALTKSGRKQLLEETADWQRMSAIINRLLKTAG